MKKVLTCLVIGLFLCVWASVASLSASIIDTGSAIYSLHTAFH